MPPISQMEELGTSGISLQVQKGFSSPVITHATTTKQEREDRWVLNWVIAVEVGNCGQILDILEGKINRIHYHLGLSVRERRETKLCHCLSLCHDCIFW